MDLGTRLPFLDHLAALSDGTRCRLLLALGGQELTVSELCAVLQLPQSTVSRHLRILADGGWVQSRAEGTRRLYSVVADSLEPAARSVWELAAEQLADSDPAREDARRLESVLAGRRTRSREFFASGAGEWDRLRDELFGPRVNSGALLGLLPAEWTVADLGCGTGPVSAALAPFVRRVIAIDGSQAMLDTARERLNRFDNVDLRRGELESLPIETGTVDAATLMLVLHHLPDPAKVLGEVVRVLRPEGQLLLIDMLPHERHEYQAQMGHVWLGFSERQIERLFEAAGLRPGRFRPLPPDPEARGPELFAATAVKIRLSNQPIISADLERRKRR